MKSIVFFWDTMRADHASCYGYPRKTTPCLDALADDGTVFDMSMTVTGHTGPTFTSYVTGQYPFQHNVVSTFFNHPNLPYDRIDDTTPVLQEELRNKHGLLTAAFDNLMTWPSQPAWMVRGNDYYINTVHPENPFCCCVLAEHINARLIPFLQAHKDRDFYIFVHYWDPHQPYNQPDPYRDTFDHEPPPAEAAAANGKPYVPTWGWTENLTDEHRAKVNLYDAKIHYCDLHFGQVMDELKSLGIYDDTTVVVTADHGEDMYEHNAPLEHRETYRSTAFVPCVAKPAAELGLDPPKRVPHLISTMDLAPTIFDMMGKDAPATMEGTSWLPLLRGEGPTHDYVFCTGCTVVQKGLWRVAELAVITPTHKLIRRGKATLEPSNTKLNSGVLGAPPFRGDPNRTLKDRFDFYNALPQFELYDLQADPYEMDNVADANPSLVSELDALLRAHIARNPKRWIENA